MSHYLIKTFIFFLFHLLFKATLVFTPVLAFLPLFLLFELFGSLLFWEFLTELLQSTDALNFLHCHLHIIQHMRFRVSIIIYGTFPKHKLRMKLAQSLYFPLSIKTIKALSFVLMSWWCCHAIKILLFLYSSHFLL